MSRPPPLSEDLLEALAATLEAGTNPNETMAIIARAGPASARMARRLSEELRGNTLTAALAKLELLSKDEQPVVAVGEEAGRLPSALRWVWSAAACDGSAVERCGAPSSARCCSPSSRCSPSRCRKW